MTDPTITVPACFETERLLIRAPKPGEGRELNAAILETWEVLHEWMPWARHPPTERESESRSREALRVFQTREDLPYRMVLKGGDTIVGSSGLHRIDWTVPRFEIGYWCRRSFQGKGYVTETVRGLATLAFESFGAERVEIRCDARNTASRRVAERAGFRLEGQLRRNTRAPDGTLRDTMIYGMIREEYWAAVAAVKG